MQAHFPLLTILFFIGERVRLIFLLVSLLCLTGCGKDESAENVPHANGGESTAKNESDSNLMPTDDASYYSHVKAIRERPWDHESILGFADWLESNDPPRAKLVRVQLELSQLKYDDPRRDELESTEKRLLAKHQSRWLKRLSLLDGMDESVTINLGLIDSLTLENATDEQLVLLKQIPELRQLWLTAPRFSDEVFSMICQLPNLDLLSVNDSSLTPSQISSLGNLSPWTHVDVSTETLEQEAFLEFQNKRRSKWEKISKEEQRNGAIRFLNVDCEKPLFGMPIKHAVLFNINSGFELEMISILPELEDIYIGRSGVTSREIACLSRIQKLKKLKLWDTRVESITPLAGLSSLESLSISPLAGVKMGDAGLDGLEKLTELKSLSLTDNAISDKTIHRLASLKKLTRLEIEISRIKDVDCFSALQGLIDLEFLSIEGTGGSDAVFEYLVGLKKLKRLKLRISLGAGVGFQHLSELKQLTLLELSGTGVHDQSLDHLEASTGLRTILAQDAVFSRKHAEMLVERIPDLTIIAEEFVVKSPRKSYLFQRKQLSDDVSVLVPMDWENYSQCNISCREHGWKEVTSYSSKYVSPAGFDVSIDKRHQSASQAMQEILENSVVEKGPIRCDEILADSDFSDTISCTYLNAFGQTLSSCVGLEDRVIVLSCNVHAARFDEFVPLFIILTRSLKVGKSPGLHREEIVEIPASQLKRTNSNVNQ